MRKVAILILLLAFIFVAEGYHQYQQYNFFDYNDQQNEGLRKLAESVAASSALSLKYAEDTARRSLE
uniref:Uncharacterized protein n=1 Tax=Acrobeloides nanus TaxID=290746 RepID=A0A914DTJ0_9BILA